MRYNKLLLITIGYTVVQCFCQFFTDVNKYIDDDIINFLYFGSTVISVIWLLNLIQEGVLSSKENNCIKYFKTVFLSSHLFYLICIVSSWEWVYSKVTYFGIFLIANLFYFLYYKNREQ